MRHLLTHAATVQQQASTGVAHAINDANRWTTRGTYQCLLQSRGGREIFTVNEAGLVEERFVCYFAAGAVVNEGDRISKVVDRAGNVLATNLEVTVVPRHAGMSGMTHHFEVECRVFRV